MRKLVALVCLLGITALAAAGCGSSTIDPVATAATTSNGAAGYRMTFVMNMTSSALPQPIAMTGSGSVDAAHHAGTVAFDMSIPELRQLLPSSGGTLHMDIIIRGSTLYMRLPAAIGSKLPGGKPWWKIDLSQAHSAIPGLSSLGAPGFQDPSQFLQYLRGAAGGVTKVGTDTVAGVSTTHYRATIDLSKAIDRLPAKSRATARNLLAMVHATKLPADVWIDSNNLVRRMAFSMNMAVAGGQSLSMHMQLTIPQYGPQPEPAAPPANQVSDMSSLGALNMNGAPSPSA